MIRTAKSDALYFVTLTVVEWVDIFSRPIYKRLIVNNLAYCQQNKGLDIYAYVLMSNHLHLVAGASEKTLSDILRDFKSYTSKQIFKMIEADPEENRKEWILPIFEKAGAFNPLNKYFQIWQNGNYATELYSNEVIQQKIDYIHNNPVRAGFVWEPHMYLYSSAHPNSPVKVLEV